MEWTWWNRSGLAWVLCSHSRIPCRIWGRICAFRTLWRIWSPHLASWSRDLLFSTHPKCDEGCALSYVCSESSFSWGSMPSYMRKHSYLQPKGLFAMRRNLPLRTSISIQHDQKTLILYSLDEECNPHDMECVEHELGVHHIRSPLLSSSNESFNQWEHFLKQG